MYRPRCPFHSFVHALNVQQHHRDFWVYISPMGPWSLWVSMASMHRLSKQWPRVVEDDKLPVALLLTLPGKRSWLLSLPLRRGIVWWDNCWWEGSEVPSQDVQLPSCLMSLSSNRSSNPCFPGLPLALLTSVSFITQSLSDPCTDHVDLVCDKTLHILMSSQKTPQCGKKISCPKL